MATPDSEIMPVWQNSLERTRNAMGVCCFAGSGNNTLMSSHYASDHKGICLQFDRALDLPTFSHAIHVEYEPALPAINFIVELKKDIDAILARKHPCWRYEAESRIIIDGQPGRYLQFRPEALSRLIYGCRAEYGLHETIERLLRQRLYKTEVIRRRGPWRNIEAVEFATLEWVDWFNHRRRATGIKRSFAASLEDLWLTFIRQQWPMTGSSASRNACSEAVVHGQYIPGG
jgi:hypothetical protein